MARVKRGVTTRKRHKKILGLAKGYRGRASTCYRVAIEKVEKGLKYAYRDRKAKKRDFRSLWIQRINAAARICGQKYSTLMPLLKEAGITINKKQLANIAATNIEAFKSLVAQATSK